jgi:hypothetical protein
MVRAKLIGGWDGIAALASAEPYQWPCHTAGSSHAVMGAGQKVIATLLGYSDSATTERYTHVAQSTTAALVEARWLRLGGGDGGR